MDAGQAAGSVASTGVVGVGPLSLRFPLDGCIIEQVAVSRLGIGRTPFLVGLVALVRTLVLAVWPLGVGFRVANGC